ncbi:hypothetical protein ACLB2K_071482 [Fragaria x ananassa]
MPLGQLEQSLHSKAWEVLDQEVVKQIIGIPILVSHQPDEYIWGPSANGRFSIKSATWLQMNELEKHQQIYLINEIWKARNYTIFRDLIATTNKVVATAAVHFNEAMLKNVVVKGGTSQMTPKTMWWSPPHSNHIKINFDESVQRRAVAGGFVFQDSEGKVLLATAKSFGNATIPTVEATALRDSLVKAKGQGCSNIQVEGDSKLVIDAINGRISTPWRLLKIIKTSG